VGSKLHLSLIMLSNTVILSVACRFAKRTDTRSRRTPTPLDRSNKAAGILPARHPKIAESHSRIPRSIAFLLKLVGSFDSAVSALRALPVPLRMTL
jgi:hypothetical protein